MTLEEIEKIVREKLERALASGAGAVGEGLINQDVVLRARTNGGRVYLQPGAIVTPLARDEAEKHNVELIQPVNSPRPTRAGLGPANPRRVAVGSDHGGFEMKQLLVDHLRSLGCEVLDLGTDSEEAVDYPDIAHEVARAVATGEAGKGLIVDGVGIGSAIVANKVPGVRAANCHNLFEIRNSREHNDANVLTLGGRTLGSELAKAMVTDWLEVPFGGGRHAKRVDKIRRIESDYTS